MTMPINWNDFKQTGEWFEFKEVGDAAIGEVVAVRIGHDFNGADCPELVIRCEDGEDRTLTAGQKVLRSRLAELQPTEGDKIAVVYSGVGDAKPGKAPAKLFTVQVRRADGTLIGDGAEGQQPIERPPVAPPPAPPVQRPTGSLV